MKKLNKKGFTLIELLAVIVILAIIVVVTVPTILNSIDDARKSSLNSLAKEVANWYDTSVAHDMIATDANAKILHGANENVTTEWKCLFNVMGKDSGYTGKSLVDFYGLSMSDLTLDEGDEPELNATTKETIAPTDQYGTCSAIRLNNGRAEVLLVAHEGGKFGARYSFSSSSDTFDF